MAEVAAPSEELQDGWERKKSRSDPNQVYFVHSASGRTQWEPPLKKPRTRAPALAPHLTGQKLGGIGASISADSAPRAAAPARSVSNDLFAGLPEAASESAPTKEAQKIPEVAAKPLTHIRALHLLKKHTKSRRPSSWREKVIKRTLEEATYEVKELRRRLAACEGKDKLRAEFERLARRESDCSSAKDGGSLGKFGRGQMQPIFEQAAFALEVDELSNLISTDSGVHIILRVE